MTLIAGLFLDSYPILLGDLLVSAFAPPSADIKLPTVGQPVNIDIHDPPRHIVSLKQKICIISDNLAVAWSGDYSPAERIIKGMKNHFQSGPVTFEAIKTFLSTTQYEDRRCIKLIGIFAHENGFGEFGLNVQSQNLPLFGQSRVGGSGETSFLRLARNLEGFSASSPANPALMAVAKSLLATNALIGDEISTRNSLDWLFGGFYEIATWSENKFQKIGDIGYSIWDVPNHSRDNLNLLPYAILRVDYQNELMVIRRIDFTNMTSDKDQCFVVRAIHRSWSHEEISAVIIPELNPKHWCHLIAVRTNSGLELLCEVEIDSRDSKLKFKFEDNRLKISIHDNLLQSIRSKVYQRFYETQ